MHEVSGAFSQGYVFLPIHSVGGQLLPSNVMLKYDCSEWRCHLCINPAYWHQDPHLLYERGKNVLESVCLTQISHQSTVFRSLTCSSPLKKRIFSISPIQEQIYHFHNMQTSVSQLTSIRSKLFIGKHRNQLEKWSILVKSNLLNLIIMPSVKPLFKYNFDSVRMVCPCLLLYCIFKNQIN